MRLVLIIGGAVLGYGAGLEFLPQSTFYPWITMVVGTVLSGWLAFRSTGDQIADRFFAGGL